MEDPSKTTRPPAGEDRSHGTNHPHRNRCRGPRSGGGVPQGYLLAHTGEGEGIDGAIMSSRYQTQPTIAWFDVDDIETSLDTARENTRRY